MWSSSLLQKYKLGIWSKPIKHFYNSYLKGQFTNKFGQLKGELMSSSPYKLTFFCWMQQIILIYLKVFTFEECLIC